MAGKIFGQFLHWIATETIVKTLSNNRTFQRVVLRFDKFKTEVETVAEEKASEAVKHASQTAKTAAEAASKQAKAKIDPLLAQAMLNAEARTKQLRESATAAAGSADSTKTAEVVIGGYNVNAFFRALTSDAPPAPTGNAPNKSEQKGTN